MILVFSGGQVEVVIYLLGCLIAVCYVVKLERVLCHNVGGILFDWVPCPRSTIEDASTDYNLGNAATQFSCWALLVSLAATNGILVSFFSCA